MVGGGTAGAEPSAGGMLSIAAGSAQWSFVTSLRLTGDAFKTVGLYPLTIASFGLWKPTRDAPSSLGSLDAGVRHHFLDGDTSPFIGTGLGLMHTAIGTDGKTGLGAFAEAGLDVLRTRSAGGAFLVRFDAPAYELMGQWRPFGSLAFAMRL